VLAGCAPGDEHELIPLALSAFLEAKGWNVRNFGSSLPADQIIAAVLALKPSALFLTFTMLCFLDDLLKVIDGLRRDCSECRIVIGGRGASLARPVLESRGVLVADDFASGHRLAVEAIAHA
jgi:methanogenic corrinoid protein MtbC1